jgi:hypothetical protein
MRSFTDLPREKGKILRFIEVADGEGLRMTLPVRFLAIARIDKEGGR